MSTGCTHHNRNILSSHVTNTMKRCRPGNPKATWCCSYLVCSSPLPFPPLPSPPLPSPPLPSPPLPSPPLPSPPLPSPPLPSPPLPSPPLPSPPLPSPPLPSPPLPSPPLPSPPHQLGDPTQTSHISSEYSRMDFDVIHEYNTFFSSKLIITLLHCHTMYSLD